MPSVSRLIASVIASALLAGAAAGPISSHAVQAQAGYAPRPASSYLHGPFRSVRIALQVTSLRQGRLVPVVTHTTVLDPSAIRRLVRAINRVRTVRSVVYPCPGGGPGPGPAWLTFVRPNRTVIHAFELSACEGLTVNRVGWIDDPGAGAWRQIISLTRPRGREAPPR
jgi:hypothetical protein